MSFCVSKRINCGIVLKTHSRSMFTCAFEDCECVCAWVSVDLHTPSCTNHLPWTAALVALRQSGDVTVIVRVCFRVLTKPSSFLACKNIWTGPTRCSPACCDKLSPPRCRRRRRRKEGNKDGRAGKGLRQRKRSSCKDEGVDSGEQVSLPLTGCRCGPPPPTLRPTCTPTQGSGVVVVKRAPVPHPNAHLPPLTQMASKP